MPRRVRDQDYAIHRPVREDDWDSEPKRMPSDSRLCAGGTQHKRPQRSDNLSKGILLVTAPGQPLRRWVEALLSEWPASRVVSPEEGLVAAALPSRGSVIVFDGFSLGVTALLACHSLTQVESLESVPKVFLARTQEGEEPAFAAGAHAVIVPRRMGRSSRDSAYGAR